VRETSANGQERNNLLGQKGGNWNGKGKGVKRPHRQMKIRVKKELGLLSPELENQGKREKATGGSRSTQKKLGEKKTSKRHPTKMITWGVRRKSQSEGKR